MNLTAAFALSTFITLDVVIVLNAFFFLRWLYRDK